MFKIGKRIFACILALAIILPFMPEKTRAAVNTPSGMTVLEAENRFVSLWNSFSNAEGNGTRTDCSGGTMVGNGSHGNNIALEDLKPGTDLSKTAYIKWNVEAPEAGNYNISLRYLMYTSAVANNADFASKPYAVFFVNGETVYQANFQGKNKWVSNTDAVSVALKQGKNEIIAIPLAQDVIQALGGNCYANVDCLYVQNTLKAVKNVAEAENTELTQWNGYKTTENNSNCSGGVQVGGSDASKNVYYADLKEGVDLSSTAYIKWTVSAPSAGSYQIGLREHVQIGGTHSGSLKDKVYATFFVNGKDVYQAQFNGENKWVYDTDAVSVDLEQGTNEIIVIPLVKDIIDAHSWGWANVDCLYLDTRLTAIEPIPEVILEKAEAEDTAYAQWNLYKNVEENPHASNGNMVGGGQAGNNLHFADLKSGADLTDTAYVKWLVNAKEAGEYTLGLRYSMKINDLPNDAQVDGYGVFFINGQTAVKAKFLGKNNWVYDTENVKVTLQKGINEIVVIPLIKDITDALGNGWANVDCLYLDSGLTLEKNRIEVEDTAHTAWHGYHTTENNTNASAGVIVGGGNAAKNPSYAELGEDVRLGESSYVKWAVDAPEAGKYAVSLRYCIKAENHKNGEDLNPQAYAAILVNGTDAYQAKFLGKNSWVYDTESVQLQLNEGYNEILVIPMVKDQVESYGGGWANVDCLYLDGKLTVLPAPAITDDGPLHLTLEAEDTYYTQWNSYNTTEAHNSASGGMQAAGGAANRNLYYADLQEGADLSSTAYVKWVFDAPKDGNYTFSLRYAPNGENAKAGEPLTPGAYAAFFINGADAYQAAFLGFDSWVYDTEFITAALKKGLNEVVAIPMVKDLYDAWGGGWANVDCLYYDSRLTPQKAPVKITVEAEDRSLTFWNGYVNQESHNSASGGKQAAGSSAQNNVYFKQLKKGVDLTYTSYVKWVITAPEEGDYTFSLRYAPNGDKIKSGAPLTPEAYAAFFVNGQDAYKATFLGYDNWVYNTKEISIHLKAGDNEVIAIPMVKDLYDAWGGGWANVDCLYIPDTLTVKPTGYIPDYRKVIEAEDLEYVQWNLYNNVEKHNSASNKQVAAGSNAAANIYLADLVSGADLSGTAYLKWTVIAPADGTYSFGLRMAAKQDGVKNGDPYKKSGAYATFFVNDADVYKAKLTGFGARSNWLWDTQSVNIKLHEGENEIYVIPMVKDLYDAWGGGWVNVDHMKMDARLKLKPAPVYTRFEAEHGEYNLYEALSTHLGTEDWGSAWKNDVTFDNLNEETILAVSHVKYYVNAEKAGTYCIGIGFRQGHNLQEYKDAFFGLSVNMQKKYKVPFTATNAGNNRLVYVDVELEEGDNYIYCTACLKDNMDYPQFPSQKNAYILWIDHDYILLPEGLTSTVANALPNWTGDDEADYNQGLLSVWGDLQGQPVEKPQPVEPEKNFDWIWGLLVVVLAAGGALLAVTVMKKKTRA